MATTDFRRSESYWVAGQVNTQVNQQINNFQDGQVYSNEHLERFHVPYLMQMSSAPSTAIPVLNLPVNQPRLNKDQHKLLEAEFRANQKPTTAYKKELALQMQVPHEKINNWFQNRRAKEKQQKKKGEFDMVFSTAQGTIAVSMPLTAGAVQPIFPFNPNLYQDDISNWSQPELDALESAPDTHSLRPIPTRTIHDLRLTQDANYYGQIHQGPFSVANEPPSAAFVSSESEVGTPYAESPAESDPLWQSVASPTVSNEALDTKPSAFELLDQNARRPRGMVNGNRRKSPPSALNLNSNTRSSSYSAGMPGSPGPRSAGMRRTISTTNIHRIQKPSSRCSTAQRSPVMELKAQWVLDHSHGNSLQPHAPISPYLMSSTAEQFPDGPGSSSSEVESFQFSTTGMPSSASMFSSIAMTSPPITPHSALPCSEPFLNGNHWTPPQSAPALQTSFSAVNGGNPMLTAAFPTIDEAYSERRPSLPVNNYMVSHETFLGNAASTVSDYSNLAPTANNGELIIHGHMPSTTDDGSNQHSVSTSDWVQNMLPALPAVPCNQNPVSSDGTAMLNFMTSEAMDYPAEATTTSMMGSVDATCESMTAAASTAPVFLNPFQQATTTRVSPEFIQWRPNTTAEEPIPAPRAQNPTTGLVFYHSKPSDYDSSKS